MEVAVVEDSYFNYRERITFINFLRSCDTVCFQSRRELNFRSMCLPTRSHSLVTKATWIDLMPRGVFLLMVKSSMPYSLTVQSNTLHVLTPSQPNPVIHQQAEPNEALSIRPFNFLHPYFRSRMLHLFKFARPSNSAFSSGMCFQSILIPELLRQIEIDLRNLRNRMAPSR